MSNLSIEKLFKKIKIKPTTELLNSKITYFGHNPKTNCLKIVIKVPQIIEVNSLIEFKTALKTLLYSPEINFEFIDYKWTFNLFKMYWTKLVELEYKFIGKDLYDLIKTEDLMIDNNDIVINVTSQSLKERVDKELVNWIEIFVKYGFQNLNIKTKLVKSNLQALIAQHIDSNSYLTELPKSTTINKQPISRPQPKSATSKFKRNNFNSKTYTTIAIDQIEVETKKVKVQGTIFKIDQFETKTGRFIYSFWITNHVNSIIVKAIDSPKRLSKEQLDIIKVDNNIVVYGDITFDSFSKELIIWMNNFDIKSKNNDKFARQDNAKIKRVELHTHTKMSAMDGIIEPNKLIKTLMAWNHKAIAITDHLNIQSFPEIYNAVSKMRTKENPLKVIYGCEFNVIPEKGNIVFNKQDYFIEKNEYIIFDLETTGLWANFDDIIEFGGVRVNNGQVVETLQFFVKPTKSIPKFITELTNIDDEMVKDAISQEEAIKKILSWIGKSALVAHNAKFDYQFLENSSLKFGFGKISNLVIDTLALSHNLNPNVKRHRLGSLAKRFKINYDNSVAHRADYDAEVLQMLFNHMLGQIKDAKISNWNDIDQLQNENIYYHLRPSHTTALVKNQAGLKDLFKLVSLSHTKFFAREPKIIKSEFIKLRKNLLIGSSCSNNEIFDIACNRSIDDLEKAILFYDYIEVQPLTVYSHLVAQNKMSKADLEKTILKIITTAEKLNKIVVATSDAHYINPEESNFRNVYINSKGIGGKIHPLFYRANPNYEKPKQHLRTTSEMVQEFQFLNNKALIEKIVITNTNKISDICDEVVPIKTDLYTPKIDGVEEKLKELVYDNAYKKYGQNLSKIITDRIEYELKSIIGNGFAVIYWISHKLVAKSIEAGYLVGSRGSVGSSLVATLSDITQVNPLAPHYLCNKCKFLKFVDTKKVRSGYDLITEDCPQCDGQLVGEGHNIPFETFLGFNGDKVPDIDLNFSGDYQATAHNWTKKMFGEKNVYRAGTISTVADKTAYGYIKAYEELVNKPSSKKAQIDFLVNGCVGVKRTTGQHPGGIIIVPEEFEVEDFTPINYPANDLKSEWLTTHFDFHAIHDNLLKLDLLGHDDPTALKLLEKLTGIDPNSIPNNDPQVMNLFSSVEALGIKPSDILGEPTGAMGIPEFGTQFVRKMLLATQPKTFSDLIQISGLSHGTNVWTNNAQILISKNICSVKEVIGCRDDIMTYLISKGINSLESFKIMEAVRKGKGLTPDWKDLMKKHNVENWYIESCEKIKYMFPKAHATAYVMMAWRIAWFKKYYPLEYYATFFSIRCDNFDIELTIQGKEAVKQKLINLKELINGKIKITSKEKNLIPVYEVTLEMYARGYKVENIDINKSLVDTWIVNEKDKSLTPPFTSIDGLGINVAKLIVESRQLGEFFSIENIIKRTSINKTVIQKMKDMNVFKNLQEKDQLSFF